MCGISGVAGSVTGKEELVFRQLLFMNTLRGSDSTGIANVKRDGKVYNAKDIVEPWYFFETKQSKRAFEGVNKLFIGHNRAATRGKISRNNAHPFHFDNVIGVHNGTLYPSSINKLKYGNYYETDSEALYAEIDESGIEDVIPKIEGAWALVYWDIKNQTLNMLRNSDRTLYYAFNNEKTVMFWSSEHGMLCSAMERNGISRKIENTHLLLEDTVHTWTIPEKDKAFGEASRKALKGFIAPPQTQTTHHRGMRERLLGQHGSDSTQSHTQAPFNFKPGDTNEHYSNAARRVLANNGNAPSENVTKMKSIIETIKENAIKDIPEEAAPNICRLVHESQDCRVYYDKTTGHYFVYKWAGSRDRWKATVQKAKPDFVIIPPTLAPNEVTYLKSPAMMIVRDTGTNVWTRYLYDSQNKGWARLTRREPFPELKFHPIDVRSSHCYKHVGPKGKKVPKYKAFNGKLITRDEFNAATRCGCVGCNRAPLWGDGDWGGVRVVFVDDDNHFLCEYCSLDKELMKAAFMSDDVKDPYAANRIAGVA